jgi:hypothetical protein
MKQLEDNLRALDVVLSAEHRARLDTVSAITLGFPHDLLRRPVIMQSLTRGTVLPARTW